MDLYVLRLITISTQICIGFELYNGLYGLFQMPGVWLWQQDLNQQRIVIGSATTSRMLNFKLCLANKVSTPLT